MEKRVISIPPVIAVMRTVRLSPEKNKRGCTSGVAVDERDLDTARLILKRYGIAYSGTATL